MEQHAPAAPAHIEPDFRWRGREITRVEGFSDAAFAFALTLLVVSLEVPRTFDELQTAMRGFVAFALCFAVLVWVWYEHHRFFRRYGLQDPVTVTLNAVLLFLVLFYVYPLKFLVTLLTNTALGFGIDVEIRPGQIEPMIRWSDSTMLLMVYSLGLVAVFVVLALMYRHALARREELGLDPLEVLLTRQREWSHWLIVGIALVSTLVASLGGHRATVWSGMIYWLIGPSQGLYWWRMGVQRERFKARLGTPPEPPPAPV